MDIVIPDRVVEDIVTSGTEAVRGMKQMITNAYGVDEICNAVKGLIASKLVTHRVMKDDVEGSITLMFSIVGEDIFFIKVD